MKLNIHPGGLLSVCLTAIIFVLAACNAGQDNDKATARTKWTKPYQLPHMWVDAKNGIRDEQHFFAYARALSSTVADGKETDSIFYSTAEFKGMIEAFGKMAKIAYVDMFPIVDGSGKLSLLFVPKDSNYKILGYYQLDPSSPVFDLTKNGRTKAQWKAWTRSYKNTIKGLDTALDADDPYNYSGCDSDNAILSNTLHISHYYNDFEEIDTEFNYQLTDWTKQTITGVTAFFSAEPANPGKHGVYSNRLFVEFEFMVNVGGKNVEFYIDTVANNRGRQYCGPDPDAHIPSPCTLAFGNDNGQLCPPGCNP